MPLVEEFQHGATDPAQIQTKEDSSSLLGADQFSYFSPLRGEVIFQQEAIPIEVDTISGQGSCWIISFELQITIK